MSQADCEQVVNDYLAGIIEGLILSAVVDPVDFRYWTEGFSSAIGKLGLKLQYESYLGWGEKPTHHRAYGDIVVHWWDNDVHVVMINFYPDSATCLPRQDASYGSMYPGEFEHVGYGIYILADGESDLIYYLERLGEPTGVVEVD